MQDVYYTKDNCVVYAEPSYESTVLTTIGANVPVRVVGMYSNGWYRINLGVIAYVKMDSVTSAGQSASRKMMTSRLRTHSGQRQSWDMSLSISP